MARDRDGPEPKKARVSRLEHLDVDVTVLLPQGSPSEKAAVAWRLKCLGEAEGIDEVESGALGDGVKVKCGSFRLLPRGDPRGCVPPALLYCFACLGADVGEAPEVTFDEAEQCLDFLASVKGRQPHAAGLVDGAIAAVEEMVSESSPLSEAHRAVVEARDVLDEAECARVVDSATAHAASRGGWTSARHAAHPTTDVDVKHVEDLEWLSTKLSTDLLPTMSGAFDIGDLVIADLFVAKYDAQGQRDLPEHEDGSPFSFVVSLSDGGAYDGGGTQFVDLDDAPIHRLPKGAALLFSGQNRHRGVPITGGTRFILAGFCDFAEAASRAQARDANP